MGLLIYGDGSDPVRIDDVLLAHLRVVITTKLRRRESFTLSWQHFDEEAQDRSTLWLHPAIPLRLVFDDAEPPALDRRLIEELTVAANSSGGIRLTAADRTE